MHIDVIDDLKLRIYLYSNKYAKFESKEDLQNCFKELFLTLKDNYNININGFYNINVYKDKYYGIILELENEDIDYIDYFDGQVDMNITLENNTTFLYEIDDYFNIDKMIIDKIKIYKYKGKIYIQIIDLISSIYLGKLIEFSRIIYGDFAKQIMKHGEKIEVKKYLSI